MRPLALALAATLALAAAACETIYEFEPVPIGDDDGARAPRPRTNQQFVRAIYADLVGRAPETYDFRVVDPSGALLATFRLDEQALLLFTLDGVGDPAPLRALIAAGLVRSAEVALPEKDEVTDPATWIADQFRRLLGREPNAYELKAFLAEWEADPAVNPRTVVRAIVQSREYQSY